MYKYNPFIMQNIRANTLIIGANNNPINKKVRLNADFSINYKKYQPWKRNLIQHFSNNL